MGPPQSGATINPLAMGAATGTPGLQQTGPFVFGNGVPSFAFGTSAPPASVFPAPAAAALGKVNQAASILTGSKVASENMDRSVNMPAPTFGNPGFGPPLAPECAKALPRIVRALSDKHEAEQAIRGRLPSGMGNEHVFEHSAVIARDMSRLTMDTFLSMDPQHQAAPLASIMFITPVTNPMAPHEVNPFMIPAGSKMPAALKRKDRLADLLLAADYSFLTPEGATTPVGSKDVFEDGLNSINLLIDDNLVTGMFTLAVFPQFVEQLSSAFRAGRLGHYFCPANPRDEPPGTLHVSIAVDKKRGSTYCVPAEVISEIWHQYRAESVYFVTDSRAFKGQFIYMISCLNEEHRDWCLRNPITLLGDDQFDAFRHKPVQGVNFFFVAGTTGVMDANLRLKADIAGFFHLPASEVNFFKVNDLVSPNVVVLRCQTRDDAATVAQCAALMSRGVILSTCKPGNPTIAYSKSHVGAPIKVAASLDELEKIVGHKFMRTTVASDIEVGEEIEQVRASPGTALQGGAELAGILAAGPPTSPRIAWTQGQTRREREQETPWLHSTTKHKRLRTH
jgi:hypothetical protein